MQTKMLILFVTLVLMIVSINSAGAYLCDCTEIVARTSGGTITAQGDYDSMGEGMDEAFDNDIYTKWLDFGGADGQSWIAYHYAGIESYAIGKYSITSANDAKDRDPKDWHLEGSNDNITWYILDTQTGVEFTSRFQTLDFTIPCENVANYTSYRLNITDIWDAPIATCVQLAEIELYECELIQSSSSLSFESFSFLSGYDQFHVNWITEYEGVVDVECTLNGVQNCNPFPYSAGAGGGSCLIESPNYDMTPDVGGELRTVQNTIYCKAYDHHSPEIYTEITRTFFPLSFQVSMPSSMSSTVGENKDFVVTVKNNGTLDDSYDVTMTYTDSETLIITNGEQSTEVLRSNDAQQIYIDLNILSTQSVNADISVSSIGSQPYGEIVFEESVNVKGGVISLPDFGIIGIIQIIAISSLALISFLS